MNESNHGVRRGALLVGALALCGLVAFVVLRQDPATTASAPSGTSDDTAPDDEVRGDEDSPTEAEPPAPPPPPAVASGSLPEAPNSLRGTRVPDVLHANESGRLVLRADLTDLFEYYMSTFGEEPPEHIAARIREQIESSLPPAAAAEALAIAEDYARFRRRRGELRDSLRAADDWSEISIGDRMNRWQETRRAQFSPEVAEALFASREIRENYGAARATIAMDDSLDEAAKRAAYAELIASLPEDLAEQLQSRGRMSRLHHEVARLREAGASAAQIHDARLAAVGPELTAQLEALDGRRGIVDPD